MSEDVQCDQAHLQYEGVCAIQASSHFATGEHYSKILSNE